MGKIKRSQAIKAFLEKNTWPDLAAMYTHELECQVNVAQDGGQKVDKVYKGHNYHEYTDGIQNWKPFRMPLNPMLEATDNDYDISFDLAMHADGIGMTGWNWVKKRSMWVAYDFDAILGHSEKHQKKLTPDELEEIKKKVSEVEWVTLRKSTGGNGLHLYVYLDFDEPINNHNEHMAVGRAILSQLSGTAGFDFEAKVDTNSGNMWVWHRKMILPSGERNPEGLKLLKAGTKLKDVPKDWRDYVDVVTGRRRRSLPTFLKGADDPNKEYDLFEVLSNQRTKQPLDKDHQRLIDWLLASTPGGSSWRDDHWMLITHTYGLKEAHKALNLAGPYDTIAEGREYGSDWNCFAFPLPNGAWAVHRYTRGCDEAKNWEKDGQKWTRCYFNRVPDFKLACKLNEGKERPNGSFFFDQVKKAIAAAKMLGIIVQLPETFHLRGSTLKLHRDKRLIIEFTREGTDSGEGMKDYDMSNKSWTRILDDRVDAVHAGSNVTAQQMDKVVRHIVSEKGKDAGWVVRNNENEEWRDEPLEHVKLTLKGAFGLKPADVEQVLGSNVIQPYVLINRPFDVEYPPGRFWNRWAAKLRFEPSQNIDNLQFPTWLKILEHIGHNLTPYIQTNPWAKASNVTSGADYLMVWVAALFQDPAQRLPYLFLYSEEENSGKSTLHVALSKLMGGDPPRGYVKIDQALKANSSFNAELAGAILCAIEEINLNPKLSDGRASHNKIKELVTSPEISIHEKGQTPRMVKNYTHCIQTANDKSYCPIFKNDSRITMIRVDPIDDVDIIPPHKLEAQLLAEAPDFLAHILRLEIPPSNDRLIVPVIETEDKRRVQNANKTLVEQFIEESCHVVDGEMILWADFFEQFHKSLEPADMEKWTKRYTGLHLPDYFPKGRRSKPDTQYCIGNLSWKAREPGTPIKERLVLRGEYLIPLGATNGKSNGHKQEQDNGSNEVAGRKSEGTAETGPSV